MSLDVGLVVQGVALAGQAVKFTIDTVQHKRDRDRDDARWHLGWGCVRVAVPCPGPGWPRPRPWTARTCGRTVAHQSRDALCTGLDARDLRGDGRAHGEAPWISGGANWDCRGRARRRLHGRHRRC